MRTDNDDLEKALKLCEKAAKRGYKVASTQYKELRLTLENATKQVNDTLVQINNSPCYVSETSELLKNQLSDIGMSFNTLSSFLQNDIENLRENLSRFSISLFGRTMAGKSTLMEILTCGNGDSIGKGAQRTTRDVRTYSWNNLYITDVPGIGAFEGTEDEDVAFEAAKSADLILFLITDDAPQAVEAECLGKILSLGKPVICIINVKTSISDGKNIKLTLRDIQKSFDQEHLNTIRKQFLSYSEKLGQKWNKIPFVFVNLKAAYMAQHSSDFEISQQLKKASSIESLQSKIIQQVRNKGEFYRIKTFLDIISVPMLNSMETLLNQSLLNSTQGRTIVSKKRQLNDWKTVFERDSLKRIHSTIIRIKSLLNKEIDSFSE